MTTTQAVLLLAVAGAAAVVAGAAVLWGLGMALIVGGVFGVAAAVVLYDPNPGRRR